MGKAGILRLVNLSERERELFLDYLFKNRNTYVFDMLCNFFEEDFFKFMDLFSGENIKIPEREDVYKMVGYVKIYHYYMSHGANETAVNNACKIFNRRKTSVRRIILKVEKTLSGKQESDKPDEVEDDDELNEVGK